MSRVPRNIVFDFDDTLVNLQPLLVAALNAATGQQHSAESQWTYNLSIMYNMPVTDVWDVLRSAKVLENVQWLIDPFVFQRAVWNWAADGHNIFVCTSRGWHPDALALTDATLAHAGELPVEVIVTEYGTSKADALAARGIRPDVAVDDLLHNVKAFNAAGAHAWLLRRRWNYLDVWGNSITSPDGIIAAVDSSLGAFDD